MDQLSDSRRHFEGINRRRMLTIGAAATVMPFLGQFSLARAAAESDLRFRVLRKGRAIGEHVVTFQREGGRLTVNTHIDIVVKVLFFTAFRLKHDAQEIWDYGRLVWMSSTTNRDGKHLRLHGSAVDDDFHIVGPNGPFLAAGNLLTTNSLWDRQIVNEVELIDVQYGGEVGLVTKPLGDEQVDTPQGPVRTSRHQVITPHYAGSVFYDPDQRWVKAVIEMQGETIDYVLAT